MRRSDREITEFEEIIDVLNHCDVVRLALNGDDGYPYVVPLNFGYSVDGGRLTLYFHSALDGKKLDLISKDGRACFEADCAHELISDTERGYCSMNYKSVVGRGRVTMLAAEQKAAALSLIVAKYHPEGFEFNYAAIPATAVYKLEVESVTGKARKGRA